MEVEKGSAEFFDQVVSGWKVERGDILLILDPLPLPPDHPGLFSLKLLHSYDHTNGQPKSIG